MKTERHTTRRQKARLAMAYLRWLAGNLITSGLRADTPHDILHRVRIINVLAILAALFLLAFSISHAAMGRFASSVTMGISAVIMIGIVGYLRVSKNHRTAALLTCWVVFVFCLVRLHYAPPNSYGFFWSAMVPLLAVFTLGHRRGTALALAYIAVAGTAILVPNNPLMVEVYDDGFPLRFIAFLFGLLAIGHYIEFDRDRASRALHASDRRFQSLIENGASVYAIVDLDGTVLYESPSLLGVYGYHPEELVGTNIIEQVHPDDRDAAIAEMAELVANPGVVHTVETRYRHRDGSWRDIEVSGVSLLHDPDVGGVVLASHDITERKRAEREIREINESLEERVRERTEALAESESRLRQSEKMQAIGKLAGGIAHDFNNQLTAILSCLEMLRMGAADSTRKTNALNAATTAAKRAADLTTQLLAFARKRSGLTEPVDLRTIVREVTSLLEHSIDKRIHIREALTRGSHVVVGDPGQLHSALLNLAVNARDAMPDGGEICFASELMRLERSRCRAEGLDIEPGYYVILSVTDTGRGMSEAVKQRAFEPFFTTKPAGEGTGMGLAAVYGTARLHRGTVTIDSEPGTGTVCRLYLPLSKDETTERDIASRPPLTPHGQSIRIMIVDDEAVVRETFAMAMEEMGHRVVQCEDGETAIGVFRKRQREVDAVVLDMMMPGLGGRETFLALKAIDPNVRALLASGYDMDREAEAALEAGAAGFVQKPFRIGDIAERLIEMVQSAREKI